MNIKTNVFLLFLVVLCSVSICSGQGTMNPQYDGYVSVALDENMVAHQTVVVQGTTTGGCTQTITYVCGPNGQTCQSQYTYPNCVNALHSATITNNIGTTTSETSSPGVSPFSYLSYQTTSNYQVSAQDFTDKKKIPVTVKIKVLCTALGVIMSQILYNNEVIDLDLAYTKSRWNNSYTTELGGSVRCFVSSWCTAATTPPTCDPQSVIQEPYVVGQQASCKRYYNTDWFVLRYGTGPWKCFPTIPGQNAIGDDGDSSFKSCTKL
jgi:hypothetical protein